VSSVKSPWPPFRIPLPTDSGFEDPRKLLYSSEIKPLSVVFSIMTLSIAEYTHGFIFNLLYKAVHHDKCVNDFITSLAVHLLELAVTFPQTEGLSGKVKTHFVRMISLRRCSRRRWPSVSRG